MMPQTQRALLQLARRSVAAAALGERSPSAGSMPADPDAQEPSGVFVTLHEKSGALRGCVGTTAAAHPLAETVAEMAQAAALRDPRFDPVRPDEVPGLQIEISVLTPLERIHGLDEVEVGTHGLVVEGRGRRGLLLPQVASEHAWSPTVFAEQTCRKAGLSDDAYLATDVALYRFRTDIMAEH